MKKYFALILLVSAVSFAQIKFEKGYFIDNQNVRTDCLIRNIDWRDTPSAIDYKLTEDSTVQSKKNSEISEFGVGENVFISVNVAMDMSSDWVDKLSLNRNPEFETVRIFMKRLVDGQYELFRYDKNEMMRFFFSSNNGPVKQLIYKRYFSDADRLNAAKNNTFRQQLRNEVKCSAENPAAKVENLNYSNNDLVKYFEAVNQCYGSTTQTATVKAKSKGEFNLAASVFFGQHSFSFDHPNRASHDFGSKAYVSFGAEAEYILPFWNNKWSAIGEVSYNKFEKDDLENGESFSTKFSYILISAGFRHYFFLTPKSKIFVNAVINYEGFKEKDSFVQYASATHVYPAYDLGANSIVPAIGVGYNFGEFFIELRADMPGNPSPYAATTYSYSNYKLIARYQFL
jgi:hypothetical protein